MGLYEDVTALDRSIAERWKARVKDRMKQPVLTSQDIDYIVQDIVKSLKTSTGITEGQGGALILISNASIEADERRSAAGIERLRHYVNKWDKALQLNLKLVQDSEFPMIVNALGNELASRIRFKSPGTGISYAPFDYQAVGQLIQKGEIDVFYSASAGLSEYADARGTYRSSSNTMILTHILGRRFTLVHEATHVIQDWLDVKSFVHHEEADAFIAGSIARFATLAEMPDASEFAAPTIDGASLGAARLVIENKAVDGDKDWLKSYQRVVAAVANVYKEYGVRSTPVEGKEGNREKTRYQQILKELADARKAARPS